MKLLKLTALTLLFAGSSAFANQAQAQQSSAREVPIAINEAFVPGGFDSESEAYVVASGIFPNGCYQWNRAAVEHDRQNNVHTVKAFAEVSQGMCIMVLVPFTKEISLGQLSSGEHKVRFVSGDGTYMEKTIAIE